MILDYGTEINIVSYEEILGNSIYKGNSKTFLDISAILDSSKSAASLPTSRKGKKIPNRKIPVQKCIALFQ